MHKSRSEDSLQKWVLSCYHVDPENGTQVICHGSRDLNPLTILLASETKDLRFRFQDSPGSNSRLDWFAIEIDTNRGTHALSCLPPRLTQDWLDSPSFFLSLCLQLLYVSLLCLCCALGDGRAEIATSMSKASIMQYEALNMQPLYFLHKF